MRPRALLLIAALLPLGLYAAYQACTASRDPAVDTTPPATPRAVAPASGSAGSALQREAVLPDDTVRATTRVRVEVTLPNGDPAAGAQVSWRSATAASPESPSPEAVTATDAQGIAEIEAPPDAVVSARRADLYGEGDSAVNAGDGTQRVCIELAPDVDLVVDVVDTLNRPRPGMLIDVVGSVATQRRGVIRSQREQAADAQGRVVLPHLPSLLGTGAQVRAGTLRVRCIRHTRLPDGNDATVLAERVIEWAQLMQNPRVTLQVPVGGTIALHLHDPNGVPLHYECELRDANDALFGFAETEGDLEVFRGVPVAGTWRIRVAAFEHESTTRGPSQPDEVVHVDVPCTRCRWILRGRIVRADGIPFPNGVRAAITPRIPGDEQLGEWREPLNAPFAIEMLLAQAELPRLEVHVNPPLYGLAAPKTFGFERTMRAGEVELGDLVLPCAPDVVTLATVEVHCGERLLTHESRLRLVSGAKFLAVRHGDTIELRGRPENALELLCDHPDCLQHPRIPLECGAHLRIELRAAAQLRVDLARLSVPGDALRGELIPLRPGQTDDRYDSWPRDGSLQWWQLEPGPYALRIRCGEQVLCEQRELTLDSGRHRWPTDGRPIDAQAARVFRVVAHSSAASGEWLDIEVWQAAAHERPFEDRPGTNGWFAPRREPADLLVTSRGFVPARVVNPLADVSLRLQPLTTLEVHTPDGEPCELSVRIVLDAVRDEQLRACDGDHLHSDKFTRWSSDDHLAFPPGTDLEIHRVAEDGSAPVNRVTVGTTSPQRVSLR